MNEPFFVTKFTIEHEVYHDPASGEFLFYDSACGLWREVPTDDVKKMFSDDLKSAADHFVCPQILNKRTNALLSGLTEMLRGHASRQNPKQTNDRIIHVANGMLHLDESGGCELRPFAPEYYSRNQSPIAFEAGAACSRFHEELLGPALPPEDITLLQKVCGQVLLGDNPAQVIMIFHGVGGGGKGTIVEVIEGIAGRKNVAQLRTKHLEKQFEIAAYAGKTLLCGRDVPGNFLNEPGAQVLKSLVGRDLLDGEIKGGNKRSQIMGKFNVFIAANSRLRVKLDGDVSAWRRRLLLVPFVGQVTSRPIPKLAEILVREEGPGILNWMLEGARLLAEDLAATGRIQLTPAQRQRVEDLLCESDSVRDFVRRRVIQSPGRDVTSEQLVNAYEDFCSDRGWSPQPRRLVQEQLVDAMLDIHHAQRATDIERQGKNRRGYRAVFLSATSEENL